MIFININKIKEKKNKYMSICAVCFKKNIDSNLKTIGDQFACSLSCVGRLKPNSKDSCNYCQYPVWKDNYYKINNKYYCSENCKNKIIKQLNIPYDSKLIQHFQENIFSNDNDNIDLKNSKQLREEVLKFYKDFHFDTIIDEENDINNDTNENDKNKKYKKITKEKPKENVYKNKNFNTYNIYNNNRAISNNNRKHNLTKNYAIGSIQEKDDKNLSNKTKNINIDKNKNNNFKTTTNNQIKNKINKNEFIIKRSEKVLTNKYNLYMNEMSNNNNDNNDNHTNSYSFVNTIDNPRMMNSFNTSNNYYSNNVNKNGNRNNNLFSKSPIIYTKNNKCMNCGNILGHVKILDRNNNAFCSDYCKEYYLSCYK